MIGVIQQQIEDACIKGGSGLAICGGAATVFTSEIFWGTVIAAIGACAAWWGAIRRDRREAQALVERLAHEQEEHDLHMELIRANPDRRVS